MDKMSPEWKSGCCNKGGHRLGNILYCFTCGAIKAAALATPAEDPLLPERRKYDGLHGSMPSHLA